MRTGWIIVLPLLLCCGRMAFGQELFVFTEPASNMPAHATGLRLNNTLMQEAGNAWRFQLAPEVMWGAGKKLMLHAEAFFSDRDGSFGADGALLYGKYRFLSRDAMHRHFRMAGFARAGINRSSFQQQELAIGSYNSGLELGLAGTQLLHKTALSATLGFARVWTNPMQNEAPATQERKALSYSLSAGQLLLPHAYNSYRQTNLNLMLEALGQWQPGGAFYLDAAPSVQLIFNSQTRLDLGYRRQLAGNMVRAAESSFLLRVEHVVFSWRKRAGKA